MEDGEGGEDESMQEGAEEGRRPLFRKSENQPSSQEVQEHMKTHIPYRSWCAHCVRGRVRNNPHKSGGGSRGPRDHPHLAIDYGFLKANNPDDPADHGSNPILIGYGLTLAMAVPGKGNAAPWIAKRVADWLDFFGSQTVTLKCDNEPAILALAQEIRRLRRESSITVFEHPEEGEKQSNHLAEGSVNIVKGLIRTLKSSTESNLRTEIGLSHPLIPWIIEHAAQLKNRYMVGADGRTPTERLRDRGVQRPVYELGEKVLFLPLALARRGDFGARFDYGIYLGCRSFDGQAYIGTPSGVIRCRTVRQLSAQERWDREFVLSIKGTPWSPDGERAGDVNIRVDLPEARGERGAHPPDIDPPIIPRRMRLTREMFERFGLTAQCLGCRAFRTGIGYPANHTERCRERIEQELEKEPEGASKVARDRERIKRARHEERARDMRIEEPDQRPDREVIEGTGASSSRDGAGNEPPPRPAESSVSVDQLPREQSDDADMGDPESDRRRPRESVVEERETKRVRINVFNGEESDEWVETEEEWVRIHRRPRRDLLSPHDSQGGPKLSDISRRRESIVCSTDGGEWREWTGSTIFRKSWGVLCDFENENQMHSKTCSSDIEQMQPPVGDDFSLDENGGIFDLRPKSQQGKRWNLSDQKDQRAILWLIRKKRPKLVIGCGKCILFCTVLYHEQIRRGAWFLHDLSGDASQLSLPCMIRLECRMSSTRLVTQEAGETENE